MSVFFDLEEFYHAFDGEKEVLGLSEEGRNIYCFTVSKTNFPVVIVQYGMHAREYITTYLALEQIREFIKSGKRGRVHFIPMLNPDGVYRVINGDKLYKANGLGVDLNVNFPAKWGSGKSNVRVRGKENYIGEYPLSAKESRLLADFTLKVKPSATISYHSKGEEIYWFFNQKEENRKRDKILAEAISKLTGYPLKFTPNSAGGYKDWCIEKLKIPALTIEVGEDYLSHPIDKKFLPKILKKNKSVINAVTESKIWN